MTWSNASGSPWTVCGPGSRSSMRTPRERIWGSASSTAELMSAPRSMVTERIGRPASPSASVSSDRDSRTSRSVSSSSDSNADGSGGHHPIAHRLQVALEIGERRPQLVGRIRDELVADAPLLLECDGHLVERIREGHDLLGTLARHPAGVVALGDALGCLARHRGAGAPTAVR